MNSRKGRFTQIVWLRMNVLFSVRYSVRALGWAIIINRSRKLRFQTQQTNHRSTRIISKCLLSKICNLHKLGNNIKL